MNMQAIMKQAQAMQKEMLKTKEEIDNTEFVGTSSFVKAYVMGNKKIKKIEITESEVDDTELLGDMITVAINNAMEQIDVETERKMGKFGNSIPGLF